MKHFRHYVTMLVAMFRDSDPAHRTFKRRCLVILEVKIVAADRSESVLGDEVSKSCDGIATDVETAFANLTLISEDEC